MTFTATSTVHPSYHPNPAGQVRADLTKGMTSRP